MTARDSSSIRIRDIRAGEHDAVAALTWRAYAEYERVMAPSAWLGLRAAVEQGLTQRSGAEWIVAERNGRLVGSVMLFAAETSSYGTALGALPWPEVRLLAVPPEERSQGTAAALLEECVRRARAGGATRLGLHSSRSMAAAVRLYRKRGFVRDPARDFQPPGAELVEAFVLDLVD